MKNKCIWREILFRIGLDMEGCEKDMEFYLTCGKKKRHLYLYA
jgi:hypothetical protein